MTLMKRSPYIFILILIFILLSLGSCTALKKVSTIKKAPSPAFIYYPPPPDPPRLQFLASVHSSRQVWGLGSFGRFVLGTEPKGLTMRRPFGVATYQGKVYAVDSEAKVIFCFNYQQKDFSLFSPGGQGALSLPIGITIGEDGSKYVIDTGRRQVVAFDANDQFVAAYGRREDFIPGDVAVQGERLFITNMKRWSVEVWDKRSGKLIQEIRPRGKEAIPFPVQIALDQKGRLYVVSAILCKVQVFDQTGRYLRAIGEAGDAPGFFSRPKGIAIDQEGRVYVVDAAFENVQIFDEEGRLLMWLGGPGIGPGEMYLPADITISYDPILLQEFNKYTGPGGQVKYLVMVTNQYGPNCINVYGFLQQPGVAPTATRSSE